ncbi:hypothetical protein CF319_g4076 [Tilletia indica]|nr:hypothetical protein CF319_g4076 [Tilletia indica]KAE8229254.1 hypothetical protein CF326_g5779 [Tilletia indica]
MDLYSRFDLPPPPPPTFLSRDHSTNRARFPEFQDAAELMDFVRVMVIWNYPAWIIVTYIVTISVVCIYVAVSFLIIIKKVRRRAPWVLRFGNRRSLVVPHAQNSWTLCCTVWLIVVLGCVCDGYFAHRAGRTLKHNPLWINALILPIASGTWFQVWGLVIAVIPAHLSGALVSSRVPAQVLNAIFIGTPPVFLMLCIALSGAYDYHWNHVVAKDWPAFRDRYGSETELSREMLVDAQKIWDHLLQMYFLLSINLIAWVIVGSMMVVLHVSVVFRTVLNLRKFLATREAIQRRFRNGGSSHLEHTDRQSAWRFLSKQIDRIRDFRDQNSSRGTGSLQTKWDSAGSDPSRTPVDPPSKQELPVWRSETPTGMAQMMGHQRAQKVLVYFAGQCACVSIGGSSLVGLGIALTVTFYPSIEQQSRDAMIPLALVAICYITLGMGLIALTSMAYSSFEAPFSALMQAKIFAAETAHLRSASTKAVAKDLLPLEVKDRGKGGQGPQSSSGVMGVQSLPHVRAHPEFLQPDLELRLVQFSRRGEGRPNSVCRPTPPEAIVLHSRRTNPTALNGGSANSSTTFALPALQFSYYDQEAGGESANSYQVPESQPTTPIGNESPPSSQLQPNYPSWAPFSSYHE